MKRRVVLVVLGLCASLSAAGAQPPAEYRAIWVDALHTPLNTAADIQRIVNDVRAGRFNTILAEVRHRGDAWYLRGIEPVSDSSSLARGFDPLAQLIRAAHRHRIEVHAFVTLGIVWSQDPAAGVQSGGLPRDPNHIFRRWSGFDPATRRIVPGPDNWLTRTLQPDGNGISYDGHRIDGEFWVDFGHPAAAAHAVAVIERLVRRYDVDGLHLDRIRYPDFPAPGQTATTGASIGYNAVSLQRFHRVHDRPSDSAPPPPSDPHWSAWRRAQVTSLVRRIYLTVASIKPALPVSAALIAFGDPPTASGDWETSEAFWRVYQDWRAWLDEGVIDIAMPMVYRDQTDPEQARQFEQWVRWLSALPTSRCVAIGLGAFLNSPADTLRQAQRARRACGLAYFSYANAAATAASPDARQPAADPLARRPFETLAAILIRGIASERLAPIHQGTTRPPVLSWKHAPTRGHVMGTARSNTGAPLDSVLVTIDGRGTRPTTTTRTDGNGFFGVLGLPPGAYAIGIADDGRQVSRSVTVRAGRVTETRLP